MKVSFEIDTRLVVMSSMAGFVCVAALHAAYPQLFRFWPTDSEQLAAWVQAVGSIFALGIAVWIPWRDRQLKYAEQKAKAFEDANITIRFHTELIETNEGMLRVAIEHLPDKDGGMRPDASNQVLLSIRSLRAIGFAQIKTVADHDPVLGRHLADFRCELQFLTGIVDRNSVCDEFDLVFHATSIGARLRKLQDLATQIRDRTTPGG